MYFRQQINQTDLRGFVIDKDNIDENLVKKVLFKSIVYRLINKMETFIDFKGIPDENNFSQFLNLLKKKKSQGVTIFTAAHQVMGYERLVKDSLVYSRKNITKLASNVVSAANKRSMRDCHDAIMKIPNVGPFFAWQILCDLLECKILGSNTDNQWVCLGPGAKDGLRRIFSLETPKEELKYTRILRDLCSKQSGFEVLDAEFPTFLHKPLSLKNVEHALCEYDKYFRLCSGGDSKAREYSQQKSRSHLDTKSQCGLCSKNAKKDDYCVKCLLCGSLYHKSCQTDWDQKYHPDGSWLCKVCHEIEKAWRQEDFDYEECDLNDNNNAKTGEEKPKMASRRKSAKRSKAAKKANKKSIECIELSSDESEEEEENITDEDDEIEFQQKYFFGIDFSDSSSHSDANLDNSNCNSDLEVEVTNKELSLSESTAKLLNDSDDENDIFILS